MKYFIATVLNKGKREEIPLYAKTKRDAHISAKTKSHLFQFDVSQEDCIASSN